MYDGSWQSQSESSLIFAPVTEALSDHISHAHGDDAEMWRDRIDVQGVPQADGTAHEVGEVNSSSVMFKDSKRRTTSP